jgi:hypothetical protein
MPRYLCSSCHEVVEIAGTGRFDWCGCCGAPLTAEDRLPVKLLNAKRVGQAAAQASGGSVGGAAAAAPALATTTSPIAASSAIPSISPKTT